MSKESRPCGTLVLGHPRSGTTLLRRLLNAHSSLAAPPETHLFSACARFLESDKTADGVDMGVLAGLYFSGFEDAEVRARLRTFAFSFLEEFAARQGKPRWVEKTAVDVFRLRDIEALCENRVFYLGIIRHPLDVAVSCKEFCDAVGAYPAPMHAYVQRYPQPIEAFVRSWVDTSNAMIELGNRRPSRCLICRYEDLVEDPEGVLGEILNFIGEEAEPDLFATAFNGLENLGFSDHKSYQVGKVHGRSIDRWRSLPRPQIDRLAPLISPLLDQFGYDPIEPCAPLSVEQLRHRYATSLAVHAGKKVDD